jgi:hypothetical protein
VKSWQTRSLPQNFVTRQAKECQRQSKFTCYKEKTVDELVKTVSERTGLPEDQARKAAEAVLEFLTEKTASTFSRTAG